jgi:hypothetical protein
MKKEELYDEIKGLVARAGKDDPKTLEAVTILKLLLDTMEFNRENDLLVAFKIVLRNLGKNMDEFLKDESINKKPF